MPRIIAKNIVGSTCPCTRAANGFFGTMFKRTSIADGGAACIVFSEPCNASPSPGLKRFAIRSPKHTATAEVTR